MKGYHEYYSRSQHPSYPPQQYLNYELLKSKLKQFYDRRRQLSQIVKTNDGALPAAQFQQLSGGQDISGRYVDLGSYFGCGDDEHAEFVDVGDAMLRLSIIERKGEF
jgi:hypothetical protein